eukprot:gnl/MRDRNA2_/MRDRNA2_74876_c0_seq3.p1 gnl/MRDRNA2_/MRDRNA2_74876_c0~~gnl/MRDRNA2_/MRDRNA2_74876_c0_seq3.p1  ORF type:complete len:103 (+),score=25.54 gnl/MRDRNA2_/MRDRNA2_74876_c0_seq3:62-370(+)
MIIRLAFVLQTHTEVSKLRRENGVLVQSLNFKDDMKDNSIVTKMPAGGGFGIWKAANFDMLVAEAKKMPSGIGKGGVFKKASEIWKTTKTKNNQTQKTRKTK